MTPSFFIPFRLLASVVIALAFLGEKFHQFRILRLKFHCIRLDALFIFGLYHQGDFRPFVPLCFRRRTRKQIR